MQIKIERINTQLSRFSLTHKTILKSDCKIAHTFQRIHEYLIFVYGRFLVVQWGVVAFKSSLFCFVLEITVTIFSVCLYRINITNINRCFLKLILCSGFKIVSPELDTFYRYTLIFLLYFLMITNKD